jgi:hypothetical protein
MTIDKKTCYELLTDVITISFVFYLQAFQLEYRINRHKNMVFCVVIVRVGDLANPALDFND